MNIGIMIMLSIVLALFGFAGYRTPGGINHASLLLFCAVFGFGGAFLSLAISKWIAKFAYRIRILDPNGHLDNYDRWLLETVHDQAQRAGLKKMPEVGIYDSPEINAFATGPSRNNSLVAFSAGLLGNMSHEHVAAVSAHEVGHVANGDMVTMTLLQGVLNTFVMFISRIIAFAVGNFVREELRFIVEFITIIALQLIFGVMASIVLAWYSRQREFKADAFAAGLTSREAMAGALESLGRSMGTIDRDRPQLASMKANGVPAALRLFSTHPPIEERIARLRNANSETVNA